MERVNSAAAPAGKLEFFTPLRAPKSRAGLFGIPLNVMRVALAGLFTKAPAAPVDGQVETLDGVAMTHRFVRSPGDGDLITWHYVEAGAPKADRPTLVFLHGVPESWYMWHHQIAAFAPDWHCIAPDLKGYGLSEKGPGDYRQEGVGDQLHAMLRQIGVERAVFITHDRGTVISDYLIANHPEMAVAYVRGEQHLVNFHPSFAPQEQIFLDPKRSHVMSKAWLIVPMAYAHLARRGVPTKELLRTKWEFSYPGIGPAVLRYFNSSSFIKEWRDRRTRLIQQWRCPVLVLQGQYDELQNPANYKGIEPHFHDVEVKFVDAGHFYVLENPSETTEMIRDFLKRRVLNAQPHLHAVTAGQGA